VNGENASHKLEQAVANDLRTNELGITVEVMADHVVLRGEVASRERRDAVLAVVREKVPDADITDELVISGDDVAPPQDTELISPSHRERTIDDA
jgi:hypothetical protein